MVFILRIPKTTLRLGDSLEGPTGISHSYGLLQQDTDENQPRERAPGAKPGKIQA